MFLEAAMDAIVETDEVAVVGADLSLSGMSSMFCPSPPVTTLVFIVTNFPSKSNFSLTIVDEYKTLFFCFSLNEPNSTPFQTFRASIPSISAVSESNATCGYNCKALFILVCAANEKNSPPSFKCWYSIHAVYMGWSEVNLPST